MAAVEETFRALLPDEVIVNVVEFPQPSGVSDMPMSDEETRRGCEARLRGLQENVEADFYISFEGGMGKETFEVFAYCAVALGRKYKESFISVARGGSFILPPGICERVRNGTELGPATDEEFQASGGKEVQGTIGLLTRGRMTRKDEHCHVLELALVPFQNAERYFLSWNPLAFKDSKEPDLFGTLCRRDN